MNHALGDSLTKNTSDCTITSPDCGNTPTPFFSNDNILWLVYEKDDHVYITHSKDFGKTYLPSIAVNPIEETIYTNGENRPKVVLNSKGNIFVSWTEKTEGFYSGNIRFSRSLDGGENFQDPITINTNLDPIGHRFDELAINSKDELFIAWLDKRDNKEAKENGQKYNGTALYYAVSTDSGSSFSENRKIADETCECCRLAHAELNNNDMAFMWRHIFNENTRDHALVTLSSNNNNPVLQRVTFDDWNIDSCPHHGPAMSRDREDYLHLTWFTQGSIHKGIIYKRYNLKENKVFDENDVAQLVVDSSASAAHPDIISTNDTLYLAWKAFNGKSTDVLLITSNDNGVNWSNKKIIANTIDHSDHPLLVNSGNKVFLSWLTKKEGYRLIPIND